MRPHISSAHLRSLAAGFAGFLVYGGWAFHVNSEYGHGSGIKAGIVQGSYSFILTLGATMLMEYLWTKLQSTRSPVMLTLLAANLFTLTLAYTINWIFATPEILTTIAPGFLIGVLFTSSYVMALSKLKKDKE